MNHPLFRAAQLSAVIAVTIFSIVAIGERFFPQFYPTPVSIWLLPLLFGVAFVPRTITWVIDVLIKRSRARRKRKT